MWYNPFLIAATSFVPARLYDSSSRLQWLSAHHSCFFGTQSLLAVADVLHYLLWSRWHAVRFVMACSALVALSKRKNYQSTTWAMRKGQAKVWLAQSTARASTWRVVSIWNLTWKDNPHKEDWHLQISLISRLSQLHCRTVRMLIQTVKEALLWANLISFCSCGCCCALQGHWWSIFWFIYTMLFGIASRFFDVGSLYSWQDGDKHENCKSWKYTWLLTWFVSCLAPTFQYLQQ